MYLENKIISERQAFRIGIMENIALGMVVVPHVTSAIAGKYHFVALLVGLLLFGIYSGIIFVFSKLFSDGYINAIEENLGAGKTMVELIYVFRYLLRGAVILLYFGTVIQEYLLRSFSKWGLIIIFVLVCGYGALRSIEKRGRLLELLFWWLVIPIILVGVFSISNIDWRVLPEALIGEAGALSTMNFPVIGKGGYMVLLVMSSVELLLYSLAAQKNNSWENALKIFIWIVITIILAYVFIIGILGYRWTGKKSTSVFNVMEASAFPGGAVERMDYPVLGFWIIGIFAVVSGYLFYAKEHMKSMLGVNKNKCYGLKQKLVKYMTMPILIIITLIFVWCWSDEKVGGYLAKYILYVDLALSISIPLIVFLIMKLRQEKLSKKAVMSFLAFCVACSLTGCKDKLNNKQLSLENRDYVVSVNFDMTENQFDFKVADLSDYKGASSNQMETKDFNFKGNSIRNAIEEYYEKEERQLDVGHIEDISIEYEAYEELKKILLEIEEFSSIPKSIEVTLRKNHIDTKKILREMIKAVYAGEEF